MQDRWFVYLLRYRGTDPKGRKVWAEGIPAVPDEGMVRFLMAKDMPRLMWLERYRAMVEAAEGPLKLYEFALDRVVTDEELPTLTCQNGDSMVEMFVYMSRQPDGSETFVAQETPQGIKPVVEGDVRDIQSIHADLVEHHRGSGVRLELRRYVRGQEVNMPRAFPVPREQA